MTNRKQGEQRSEEGERMKMIGPIKECIKEFIDSVEYFWQEDRFFVVFMLATLSIGIGVMGFSLIMLIYIILS